MWSLILDRETGLSLRLQSIDHNRLLVEDSVQGKPTANTGRVCIQTFKNASGLANEAYREAFRQVVQCHGECHQHAQPQQVRWSGMLPRLIQICCGAGRAARSESRARYTLIATAECAAQLHVRPVCRGWPLGPG